MRVAVSKTAFSGPFVRSFARSLLLARSRPLLGSLRFRWDGCRPFEMASAPWTFPPVTFGGAPVIGTCNDCPAKSPGSATHSVGPAVPGTTEHRRRGEHGQGLTWNGHALPCQEVC
jgi:hypothetical protein